VDYRTDVSGRALCERTHICRSDPGDIARAWDLIRRITVSASQQLSRQRRGRLVRPFRELGQNPSSQLFPKEIRSIGYGYGLRGGKRAGQEGQHGQQSKHDQCGFLLPAMHRCKDVKVKVQKSKLCMARRATLMPSQLNGMDGMSPVESIHMLVPIFPLKPGCCIIARRGPTYAGGTTEARFSDPQKSRVVAA